jgi:hypothetical protein
MLALTIKQPWAALIAAGIKGVENRTWSMRVVLGRRIAIHAGMTYDEDGESWAIERLPYARSSRIVMNSRDTRGAIVATAVVQEFIQRRPRAAPARISDWWCGPVGWVLRDVCKLEVPIQCKGAQGLWTVPRDIAAQLDALAGDSRPARR